MRYFVPKFQIAMLCPAQDRLRSKIGGLPWGLPPELWPRCCGVPQKLFAQLCHEPPMLDLGVDGGVLHLFTCPVCLGIGDDAGLAAFVVDRKVLQNGLSRVAGCEEEVGYYQSLTGEAWIVGWEERDDGIPVERLPEFYDDDAVMALHDEFQHFEWYDCREVTKFGGSPRWSGNGPRGFPPPPFEFLLQLGYFLYVDGPPPRSRDVGCVVEVYTEGERSTAPFPTMETTPLNAPWYIMYERGAKEHYFAYSNLGSDGTAFAFIDRTERPHRVRWFWNR